MLPAMNNIIHLQFSGLCHSTFVAVPECAFSKKVNDNEGFSRGCTVSFHMCNNYASNLIGKNHHLINLQGHNMPVFYDHIVVVMQPAGSGKDEFLRAFYLFFGFCSSLRP